MRRVATILGVFLCLLALVPAPARAAGVPGGCQNNYNCDALDPAIGQGLDTMVPSTNLKGLFASKYTIRALFVRWDYGTLAAPVGWILAILGVPLVMFRTWLVKICASLMVNAFTLDFAPIFKPLWDYFTREFALKFYFPYLPAFLLIACAFMVTAIMSLQVRRMLSIIGQFFLILIAGMYLMANLPDIIKQIDGVTQKAAIEAIALSSPGAASKDEALVDANNRIYLHFAIDWACIENFGSMATCRKYADDQGIPGGELWSRQGDDAYKWLKQMGGKNNPDFDYIYKWYPLAFERIGVSLIGFIISVIGVLIMAGIACGVILLKIFTWVWCFLVPVAALAALWPNNGVSILKKALENAIGCILAQFLLAFGFAVLIMLIAGILAHGDELPGHWFGASLDVLILLVGLYLMRHRLLGFVAVAPMGLAAAVAGRGTSLGVSIERSMSKTAQLGIQHVRDWREDVREGQRQELAQMMVDQRSMRSETYRRRQQRWQLQYGTTYDPREVHKNLRQVRFLEEHGIDPSRALHRVSTRVTDPDKANELNERQLGRLGEFRAVQNLDFLQRRELGTMNRPARRVVDEAQTEKEKQLAADGFQTLGGRPRKAAGGP